MDAYKTDYRNKILFKSVDITGGFVTSNVFKCIVPLDIHKQYR